jgi:hypothetical protein
MKLRPFLIQPAPISQVAVKRAYEISYRASHEPVRPAAESASVGKLFSPG